MHLFNRSGRWATPSIASIASFAVVASFAAVLAGCSGEPDNEHAGSASTGSGASASSSGAGGGAPACAVVDQACQSSAECCSAACSDGACRPPSCASGESPTPIAAVSTADITSGDQYEIALDADYIYWINGSQRIVRAPKGGGEALTVAGAEGVTSFAIDDSAVYFTINPFKGSAAGVARIPKGGGLAVTLSTDLATSIAVDEARVFWTTNSAIKHADKLTGADPIVLADQPLGSALALDATRVFWLHLEEVDPPVRSLFTIPKSGGVPEALFTGQKKVSSVALDPTSVYWAQQADIVRVAKTGGEPATIVNGGSPRAVTISDARLYWIEQPASASAVILTAPKDGGLPTTLVSGPDASWLTPKSFAVDGACLYWIDPNAGVLLRGGSS